MSPRRIEELIKPDLHQVFLMACPATLPFGLVAVHTYLVVNRAGTVNRYGVGYRRARKNNLPLFGSHFCRECVGHLHKDSRPPSEGIEIFPFYIPNSPLWRARVISHVEGEHGSVAERIGSFVAQTFREYLYAERYFLLGPNSNTYPAWILSHFPEAEMRLPWNAVGKNYKLQADVSGRMPYTR